MKKRLLSAILILGIIISCVPVYGESYVANWATEPMPDIKNMEFEGFLHTYTAEGSGKVRSFDVEELDEAVLTEIIGKVTSYEYTPSDKRLADNELNREKDGPTWLDIAILFCAEDGDCFDIFFYEDYILARYRYNSKLMCFSYSDPSLYDVVKEILKPYEIKYDEKMTEKENTPKVDKGVPITDFKTFYKATFTRPAPNSHAEKGEDGEWGLCSYKVGDTVRYGAYLDYGIGFVRRVSEVEPTDNIVKIETDIYLMDMKEYTGFGSNVGYIYLTINEDYEVTAMDIRYNHNWVNAETIDMSTYKAEGSLKDFANFKFVPNAIEEKEEESEEVQPENKQEEKPEVKEEISTEAKEPVKTEDKKQEEIKKPEEVKTEEKTEEPKSEEKEEVGEAENKEEIMLPEKEEIEGASQWAVEEVERAMELGIAEKDKAYAYSRPITREEFCDLIYNYVSMLGKNTARREEAFDDTDSEKIGLLYNMGIIKGKSEKAFAPKDSLTREEAAVILYRTANVTHENLTVTQLYFPFADENEIAHWSTAEIQAICNLGIMKGMGEERFAPKGIYTTEQAMATIVRMYDIVE